MSGNTISHGGFGSLPRRVAAGIAAMAMALAGAMVCIPAALADEAWSAAYEDFVLGKKWSTDGDEYDGYWDETNIGLYDMDADGVPELLVTAVRGAREWDTVYTFDGEDVRKCDGGAVSYHNIFDMMTGEYAVDSYPGLFWEGGYIPAADGLDLSDYFANASSAETYVLYHTTLSDGALHTTIVQAKRSGSVGYQTSDVALYEASQKERHEFPRMTLAQIREQGWDALVTAYTSFAAGLSAQDDDRGSNVYKAYRDLLATEQTSDDRYSVMAVALADVSGDSTPELIYVRQIDHDGSNMLRVVGYKDGAPVTLYADDDWDYTFEGGITYYLFQAAGDRTLQAYRSGGGAADVSTDAYMRFEENADGTLDRRNHLTYTVDSGNGEYFYSIDGVDVTQSQYDAAVTELKSSISAILMYKICTIAEGTDVKQLVSEHGDQSMTYDEAIAKLDSLAALSGISTSPAELQTMWRLYNPFSGEHFYTASEDEYANLTAAGWRYEGVGWVAPKESGTPVFRLYNPVAGDHHYTTSEEERDNLQAAGWNNEDVGWYSAEGDAFPDVAPLWRQYNPFAVAGSHNYTLSGEEKASLVAAGWIDEGVAWYAVAS